MLHEVNFQEWCPKCEHYKIEEREDPCHDCLNQPVNDDSRKPVMFKAADGKNNDEQGKTGRRRVSVSGRLI